MTQQPLDVDPIRRRARIASTIGELVTVTRQDVPALIARVAELETEREAVRTWVANTIHGAAAAEVGAIVGQQPNPVQRCGYCKRTHLDGRC